MGKPEEDRMLARLGPVGGPRIRVVLFGGGPRPEPAVKEFICRLEEHPDVEFLGAFFESAGRSALDVVRDVWRRRRWLALPVLVAQAAAAFRRIVMAPRVYLRLRKRFSRLSERVHFVPRIHAPGVLAQIRALEPDLGLVYGSPILRRELFDLPKIGSLGIHHGRMPEYRGKKTTFWEMASGEQTAGVTIQKIGKGLDRGAIVKSGAVPIGHKSYGRVWREVEELGLILYVEAVIEAKEGKATPRPVSGTGGKLYRDPRLADLAQYYLKRLKRWGTG